MTQKTSEKETCYVVVDNVSCNLDGSLCIKLIMAVGMDLLGFMYND